MMKIEQSIPNKIVADFLDLGNYNSLERPSQKEWDRIVKTAIRDFNDIERVEPKLLNFRKVNDISYALIYTELKELIWRCRSLKYKEYNYHFDKFKNISEFIKHIENLILNE